MIELFREMIAQYSLQSIFFYNVSVIYVSFFILVQSWQLQKNCLWFYSSRALSDFVNLP